LRREKRPSNSKTAGTFATSFNAKSKRFKKAATDPLELADHAFNVVVTAWHMCDWVFADLTPQLKIEAKHKHKGRIAS
jgi:hypothetical protein